MFELSCGEVVFDNVKHGIAHNAFSGREITDAHFDNPTLFWGERTGVPLLGVLGHVDDVWLPVVRLHLFIDAVGFVVFDGENVELSGTDPVDDFFTGETFAGFGFIETKGFVAELVHHDFSFFACGDFAIGGTVVEGIRDNFGGERCECFRGHEVGCVEDLELSKFTRIKGGIRQ